MLCNKSHQILCGKRISMLKDLKVSVLACNHVFYRPGHNAKEDPKLDFEGLGMQK